MEARSPPPWLREENDLKDRARAPVRGRGAAAQRAELERQAARGAPARHAAPGPGSWELRRARPEHKDPYKCAYDRTALVHNPGVNSTSRIRFPTTHTRGFLVFLARPARAPAVQGRRGPDEAALALQAAEGRDGRQDLPLRQHTSAFALTIP